MENHFLHYFHRWLATCPGPSWMGVPRGWRTRPGGGPEPEILQGVATTTPRSWAAHQAPNFQRSFYRR